MKLTIRATIWIALILISPLFLNAQGNSGDFGAGIILGQPNGITAKWFKANDRAFDAALAWSMGRHHYNSDNRHNRLYLHGDYLIHRYDMIDVDSGKLPIYYGLGARIGFGEDVDLGLRIPLGIAYHFPRDPFEVFFEIVPVLNLIPGTSFDANGGFGVRYYFGKVR